MSTKGPSWRKGEGDSLAAGTVLVSAGTTNVAEAPRLLHKSSSAREMTTQPLVSEGDRTNEERWFA